MRLSDCVEQAWANLWKKKLRTSLTTFGVVIAIGALVSMFAFGQGVQRNIREQFEALELFNYVIVSVADAGRPDPSEYDPDDAGHRPAEPDPNVVLSTPQAALDERFLEEVLRIKGVDAAFPEVRFPAQIRLGPKEQFTLVQVLSERVCRSMMPGLRAGAVYASNEPNELVISDSLLRRLGVKRPETAVRKTVEVRTLIFNFDLSSLLRMAFGRGDQRLPFSSEGHTFTICGVAERMGFGGPLPVKSDVFIPPGPAADMRKLMLTSIWDFFEPAGEPGTYSSVTVKVASVRDVDAVQKELQGRGLNTFALLDHLEEMKKGFIIMDTFLLAIGMIGITVASLGIVNTMVMSILERYREIGIMKAVGATDGDVQKIFLFESGVIGFLGGIFGLLLGWVVSGIINVVVNGLTARQGVSHIHYFSFPWWLCLGAVAFAVLVSLVAGIYPTIRAANVDPVVALRHD